MTHRGDGPRDLARLVVPRDGRLEPTADLFMPYRLVDAAGMVVEAAAAFFAELAALGRPAATHRSYGMDLLRWFRFLWAAGVPWDQATRAEARDYCRWIQLTVKPGRQRGQRGGAGGSAAGAPNPVTGKPAPGRRYAAATSAHSETVLRSF